MTLIDLAQGEIWMDPEERHHAAQIVHSLQHDFADRNIPQTTFLILRVRDYLTHHTLCRRLERWLMPNPPGESSTPSPLSTVNYPLSTTPSPPDPKLAEQIGKSRDRLRRTLKELEDAVNKLDPSAPPPGASAKGKTASKGETPQETKPRNPLDDPKFWQETIEAVGIDLNDPDFFADEDNFYDVPPYTRPPNPQPNPSNPPASTEAQPPSNPPDQSHANPNSASPLSLVNCQLSTPPAPSDLPAQAGAQSPNSPSPSSSLSTVNYPRSTHSTPPPKAEVYKVKPTPFNQSPRFMKHEFEETQK